MGSSLKRKLFHREQKKAKLSSTSQVAGPSNAATEGQDVVVKSEEHHQVNIHDDAIGDADSYQEYAEGDLEGYDDSSYQDQEGAFPTDSKAYYEPTAEERKSMLSKYIEFDQEAGRHPCAICKGDY